MYRRKIHKSIRMILFSCLLLLLSGCSKPVFTTDNTYTVITILEDGSTVREPLTLSWNTNTAVVQRLLLESSFVISDLRSHDKPVAHTHVLAGSAYLETEFPTAKEIDFVIDNKKQTLLVKSIQLQVMGDDTGKVVINGTDVYYGIYDPNLTPAYLEFVDMLNQIKMNNSNRSLPGLQMQLNN